VTPRHVLQICAGFGIPVEEKRIRTDELSKIDTAFVRGTSVDVAAIGFMNGMRMRSVSKPLLERIAERYEEEIETYIQRFKKDYV